MTQFRGVEWQLCETALTFILMAILMSHCYRAIWYLENRIS